MNCPVKKVISFEQCDIRLYDFHCAAKHYPNQSNVICYSRTGEFMWAAELPEPGELYIGMGHEPGGIWCGTLNQTVCTIELETGRITSRRTVE